MRKISFLLACCLMAVTAWATNPLDADCGDNVEISATPTTGYHFVKWQKGGEDFVGNDVNPLTISGVDGTATYRAFFAINVYNYKFVNYDNEVLKEGTINHGETPTPPTEDPTKPSTAQFEYHFAGWLPNIAPVIEDNTIFVAQFDEILRSYTITFVNWNGDVLQSSEWEFGTTPTYNGATNPTKPADAENTYEFIGWSPNIEPVNGEKTYTAMYSNTTNSYTITLTAGEGGTVSGAGTFTYGTPCTITATPNDCYEFVKWSDNDTNPSRTFDIISDVNVTAEFRKIRYVITVESDNTEQGSVDARKL